MKVLLIEDDLIQQRYVTLCMQDLGNEVETASDGYSGLKKAKLWQPDVIATDFCINDLDGLQLIALLKQDFQLRGKPIIVLTSSLDTEIRKKAMDAGAFAFLIKPLTKTSIALVFQQVLNTLAA